MIAEGRFKLIVHPSDFNVVRASLSASTHDWDYGVLMETSPLVPKGQMLKVKDEPFDFNLPVVMRDYETYTPSAQPIDYSKVYQFRKRKAPRYLRKFQ